MSNKSDAALEVSLFDERGGRYHDYLAEERPLSVIVQGYPYATLMRTPGDDQRLIMGFLRTEGVIEYADDIASISPCDRGNDEEGWVDFIKVSLAPGVSYTPRARSSYVSSSCGLCSLEESHLKKIEPLSSEGWAPLHLSQVTIKDYLEKFNRHPSLFSLTGGAHAAALFSPQGELSYHAADVGRHNAVDKVIGAAMNADLEELSGWSLFVSSRAGYEIALKAYKVAVGALITIGAASSGAHRLSCESGLPLYSFVRPSRAHRHHRSL
jgi:FdhD protein